MGQDNRRHARYDALNLLHYQVPCDEQPTQQGMGRTLNVSQSGILLETHAPVGDGETVMLTIGLADDLVVIQGEAVHCQPTTGGRCNIGIRFNEMDEASRRTLDRYIELFQRG